MGASFKLVARISSLALWLSFAGIPNAMATGPTETAVFQCNLFTSTPFNLQSYDGSTNSTIALPNGATSNCMDLLEQLRKLGLTNVNVSYQAQSDGVTGNFITYTVSAPASSVSHPPTLAWLPAVLQLLLQ